MDRRKRTAILALLPLSLWAQSGKEQAVGLVLMPAGGAIVRAGNELPLAAKAGEILFAGDALRSGPGQAAFLYCPERVSVTLAPASEALLDARQLKMKTGRAAAKAPAQSCFLPETVRVTAASQQHYGGSLVRALRPTTGQGGTLASRMGAMPEAGRRALAEALEPLDRALAANPSDSAARLARAVALEKAKLRGDAVEEYRRLGREWADAVWVRGKIFDLEEQMAVADAAAGAAGGVAGTGRTFALLVGISRYQRLPQEAWLRFAHSDAALFEKHLKSPRGGALPDADVIALLDEKATTAAVRNAFETFLKGRAGRKDTVLLFIAAHGTVETAGKRGAYILTWDSDPQDLAATALPMADVQKLVEEQLAGVGRVLLFVDVCRAGSIGTIRSTTVNSAVERLGEAEGELLGLMASRPKELSVEGPEYGGGHGAFSYFLLKALGGAADKNGDGVVDANETIAYVRDHVAEATGDRQHPRDFGNLANAVPLADTTKPGIDITRWPVLRGRDGQAALWAALGGAAAETPPAVRAFREAVAAGRLLPGTSGSAFDLLAELRRVLPPEEQLAEENRLRVALEDAGQQVLLRYLSGEQAPQTRGDFLSGAAHFRAARALTPESLYLEAREAFCEGRALLFDKDFDGSAGLLERAARLDAAGAYSFNALGIAYLERADYARAVLSFRDAARRAPYWAYPLHNLALAHAQAGDSDAAIRAYRQAMRLAPRYAYLPYNLGLLYQRLNRRKDAAAAYRQAIALAPDSGEPYNAMGSLEAAAGRAAQAEQLYRQALEKNPRLSAARHNLALLLSSDAKRAPEAVRLWEENLAQAPDYLPSRLSLAEMLARQGKRAEAAQHFRTLLEAKPDYAAARLALAEVLAASGDHEQAAHELREALRRQPENPLLHERLGDALHALGREAEARAAYEAALGHGADAPARKRIRGKLTRPPS